MFDGIKNLGRAADAAKKIGAALERIQSADANANGIKDVEELKPLVKLAIEEAGALKKTLDEIGTILGADFKELCQALNIDLVALAEIQTDIA